ncbi:sodium:alanine symporter family protein [Clostridium botulinum]|uniref:alanine/glycine:cation symporter family protein n=1 Tax=Clostridium botulinum TaxID=1491 RepID=UPI0013F0D9C6|nr:sodium:alanine symporter family protein [Clostridium botulinum]MCW6070374.1 sodium:alanine symporter family protein [Clostridium botulinum]MCW6081194.1 sodium:alanine symporter family protein [Clostridium botulinum]MCW6095713.1 sodium:alanine symporter family protein [Clostridium botulinum]NFH09714.1 sodium:alanine symporter family protein [Clostridium botulinum]NFL99017.1 sodium:alanine symporter family protein [Clostridium botulinum]
MDLLKIVEGFNNILWSYILMFFLFGAGIFFTFNLRFVQVRKFKAMFKQVFSKNQNKDSGITSFQALATAVAAQVGTGNLAGAATAIAAGGPGAIFWMWVSAFFGMGTIFSEAILAQKYKIKKDNGEVLGGPAYYIRDGFGSKKLAAFFAFAMMVSACLTGDMVQSNSIGISINKAFGVPNIVVGIIVAILTALIVLGGIQRIASVTEKLVPIMALFFIIGSLIIMGINYDNIGPAFKMIFVGAFNPKAATGGLIGVSVREAMRYGISRGLFSNEAGMGSTPHAHAVADVEHPAQQGLVAMFGLFIDTFVVLTCTAMVILTTGALDGKTTGIELTQQAFINGFGHFGNIFVAVSLFFFAFSTIIGWYFFGLLNVKFIFGDKGTRPYIVLFLVALVVGTVLDVPLVWQLADTFNGFMVIPNLIALIALAKLVKKELKDYENDFSIK